MIRVLGKSGDAVHRVAVHRGFDGKGGVRLVAERQADREKGVLVVVYVRSLAEVASLQGVVHVFRVALVITLEVHVCLRRTRRRRTLANYVT